METIERDWVSKREQTSVIHWADKEHAYVQFMNEATKQVFMETALRQREADTLLFKIIKLAIPPSDSGYHFRRREIKLEITGVRPTVIISHIDESLKRIPGTNETMISPLREGKLHGPPGKQIRSLMFKVNANGFRTIYSKLNGVIPYNRLDTATKLRLYPRINARPWSCRDCYYVGPNHQCNGKACAQCGQKGHLTKDCTSQTRFCTNCKKRGHRAKDPHCPAYLREVVKEIRRMDVPLEFLEDKELRNQFVHSLIIK